jgi:4-hydroxy-tetrahydrodipicolinate synthase
MRSTVTDPRRPFGRLITAMVTPFAPDGSLDVTGAAELATWLVDEGANDALVISGTTGESPTTTDAEKESLLRAVVEAVGDRAYVIAGVGTNDTRHSVELAQSAEKAGAGAVLAVAPYYNKPPAAGVYAHLTTIADATGLPMMIYDIPHRTGIAIDTENLCRLAEHERIVAVKDAKGSLVESSWVTRRTDLAFYSGDDAMTLPLLAVGGVGVVGTSTHLVGPPTKRMIEAYDAGDVETARHLHHQLLPLHTGIFRAPGTILVKAALNLLGRPAGPVRLPLVEATDAEIAQLRKDCAQVGVELPELYR